MRIFARIPFEAVLPCLISAKRSCLLLFVAWIGSISTNLTAQTTEGRESSDAEGARFVNLQKEIRQVEREISKRYTNMPIGFPKEQKQELEAIEALKKKLTEMRLTLDQTAIDSFAADPEQNPRAAAHIFQMAMNCIEGRGNKTPFDPVRSLELITSLARSKMTSPEILSIAFQSSMAIQDFQRAEKILKRMEDSGTPIPESLKANLEKTRKNWQTELVKRAEEQKKDDLPRVKLETSLGDIELELYEDDSPQTVANFVSLVEKGFYDGQVFFLVDPGDRAIAGCPNGNGTGDPGYRIANEPSSFESRRFFAGTVGMLHNGIDTAGSQFFITYQPISRYDLNFVAFGRITAGLDVLFQMQRSEPIRNIEGNSPNAPKIIKATVLRKRDHAYEPTRTLVSPTSPLKDTAQPANAVPDVAPKDDDQQE